MPYFTEEQQHAIFTFDKNLIVTAGAGSGKTRVLVERFMALLEAYPEWSLRSIVAITFTEKAAREMRDRIRLAIAERLRQFSPDSSEGKRWQACEAELDAARISTIHALCAQLLRANPVEAEVDPSFTVLDEVEARILQREAVDQILAIWVNSDSPVTELLVSYDVGLVRAILERYAAAGQMTDMLDESVDPGTRLAYWRHLWEADAATVLDEIHRDKSFIQALHWIDEQPHPTDDKLWEAWQTILERRDVIFKGTPVEVITALNEIAQVNLQGGKQENWGGKENLALCKGVLNSIRDTIRKLLKEKLLNPPAALDERAAYLWGLWQQAIRETRQTYTTLKMGRNALDFDDLEFLARHLLINYPAVTRRYADVEIGEFKHIMVDEFQDTNAFQREIIEALSGFEPQEEIAPAGRLFVVGDPKQSIYAFRGADVSVFRAVRDRLLHSGGVELPLSQSFRAHERLVAMYNDVFARLLQSNPGPTQKYAVELGKPMQSHRPAEPAHNPCVYLLLLQNKDEGAEARFNADEKRRWEAFEIARTVKSLLNSALPVWDKERADYRALHYGDIAFLFQSMSHIALYESAFQAEGMPYITTGGRGYYDQQEVWDLLNLLKALDSHADDLALASALRSPLFGLSDETLLALRLRQKQGKTLPLWKALFALPEPDENWENWVQISAEDQPALEMAGQVLSKLAGLAGRVGAAELLIQALDLTGYDVVLMGLPNGERRRANVQKLVEIARRSRRVSLGDFVSYLGDVVGSEARESEAALETEGVMKLMTVHASKGLEFPVVILPDCSWARVMESPLVTVDPVVGLTCRVLDADTNTLEKPVSYQLAQKYQMQREQAERRRLLYVAMTRAADYLVISGQTETKRNEGADWLSQLCEALGIEKTTPVEGGKQHIAYDWGDLTLLSPPPPVHLREVQKVFAVESAWQSLPNHGDSATEIPASLYLLQDVEIAYPAAARHINATQLEKLGQARYYRPETEGFSYFRSLVMKDMPRPVPPIIQPERQRQVSPLVVGDIVHRALKVGLSGDNPQLIEALQAYVYEQGITEPAQAQETVQHAQRLLAQYARSSLPRILAEAEQVYHEIEFVYERGKHIIHGVVDVLYFLKKVWVILDYKTPMIEPQFVGWHAQRYIYQMGAYAAAIEEKTGSVPHVHLYYLHPGVQWTITESQWRQAIDSLDSEIAKALDRTPF